MESTVYAPKITPEMKVIASAIISPKLIAAAIIEDIFAMKFPKMEKNTVIDFECCDSEADKYFEAALLKLIVLIEQAKTPSRENLHVVGIVGPPGTGKSTLGRLIKDKFMNMHFAENEALMLGKLKYSANYDPGKGKENGVLLGFEKTVISAYFANRIEATSRAIRNRNASAHDLIDVSIGMDWFQFMNTMKVYFNLKIDKTEHPTLRTVGLNNFEELWYLLPLLAVQPEMIFMVDSSLDNVLKKVSIQSKTDPKELKRRETAIEHFDLLRNETYYSLRVLKELASRILNINIPVYKCTSDYRLLPSREYIHLYENSLPEDIIDLLTSKFRLQERMPDRDRRMNAYFHMMEEIYG